MQNTMFSSAWDSVYEKAKKDMDTSLSTTDLGTRVSEYLAETSRSDIVTAVNEEVPNPISGCNLRDELRKSHREVTGQTIPSVPMSGAAQQYSIATPSPSEPDWDGPAEQPAAA